MNKNTIAAWFLGAIMLPVFIAGMYTYKRITETDVSTMSGSNENPEDFEAIKKIGK